MQVLTFVTLHTAPGTGLGRRASQRCGDNGKPRSIRRMFLSLLPSDVHQTVDGGWTKGRSRVDG